MDLLLPMAAKSFLVAGAALLLLSLAHKRSAAQRSWIAHLGLAAVLLLPIATIALPSIEVKAPAYLAQQSAAAAAPAIEAPASQFAAPANPEVASTAGTFPAAKAAIGRAAAVHTAVWIYAVPAALLLLLTLIALVRLFTLRARANVLVEPHWLTALARAQHRMGFKHGTALLTSDELPSPISWGVMRPVIVLNSKAAESHAEAEAIIAHELAHVASLDWAKLMLARVTVALFWFNPLVWLLAREAHQLREEAADDAVLGADIEDTDYARLLVGVARHECRGLLLGAHGVAPAKNSLKRRVRRVLDSRSARGPVGRAFAMGMFAGAAVLAAPLAALTLSADQGAAKATPAALAQVESQAAPQKAGSAADQPSSAIGAAVAAAVQAAMQQLPVQVPTVAPDLLADADVHSPLAQDVAAAPIASGAAVQSSEPVESINISGGGQVLVRYGRAHQVRVLRGSATTVNVSNGSLSVVCNRECGNMLVEVTTPRVEALAVQGGGLIRVASGFPPMRDLALAISGGGRIDARLLRAASVAAATQGGGTILTTADREIAASTSGGGDIRYWGNGTVATSIQGGGRIEPGGG